MGIWSEVTLSQLALGYRIDGEFYKQEYLEKDLILNKCNCRTLGVLGKVTDGEHGSVVFLEDGIKYLTAENVKSGYINIDKIRYVGKDVDERNSRARVNVNDILVSIKGTLGQIGLAEEWLLPANMNRDVAIIKLNAPELYKVFVALFLQTKYGLYQLAREGSGGVQQMITLGRLREVKVPYIDEKLQNEYAQMYLKSLELKELSKSLYNQAQKLLEKELGLHKLVIDKNRSYETSFSEITENNRFDAEFYNPNSKEIYKLECFLRSKQLKEMFNILRGQTPSTYLKDGIPVLKTKNIRIPIIDKSKINDFTKSSVGYTLVKVQDLIIASMGVGSLGRISYVFDDSNNEIIDGTLRILRAKEGFQLNIVPTLLFLTSIYGQMLIYKGIIGSTGIISLPDYHLKNIRIPVVDEEIAKKLTSLVIDSYNAKKESEDLLEKAKKKVEDLIEGGIQK